MWIGELAERSGLSRDAIRYYERVGVLPRPRRSKGGFRLYDERMVDRLAFVGRAQGLGLTLEEIREVLGLVQKGVEPCRHVRVRLRARLAELDERIAELSALRARLEETLAWAREAPAGTACRCRIIEASPAGITRMLESGHPDIDPDRSE